MRPKSRISIVKVSRHRSLDNRVSFFLSYCVFLLSLMNLIQDKYTSIKKKRSNAVIHVNIRLPKSISSINNNLHSVKFV